MKKEVFFSALILITGIIIGLGFLINNYLKSERAFDSLSVDKSEIDRVQKEPCPSVKTEERIVRGNSLNPLLEPGDTIRVIFGYYDCYPVAREDIVLFDYAGNQNPVIKIVKGISGDKFELRVREGGWNIIVNNQIVKNSEGKPYLISGNAYQMLALYEKDYKGAIPEDAYLLLGDQVSGSIDSTRFGLVDKSDILGKVEH